MKKAPVLHWTGIFGIVMYLFVLLEIPFYFVYTPTPEGTPPEHIILIRILLDLFVCMGLIGFFSGFRHIIKQHAPEFDWLGTFIFSCGIVFATVAFVADSIQAGSVWTAQGKPINPTFVGFGADGALLIYGPVNRLLTAAILFASSALIFKTGIFRKWTAWLAILIAIFNLSFIPGMFYMTTPLDFYSPNGWHIPIATGWFFLWIVILSVMLLRRQKSN